MTTRDQCARDPIISPVLCSVWHRHIRWFLPLLSTTCHGPGHGGSHQDVDRDANPWLPVLPACQVILYMMVFTLGLAALLPRRKSTRQVELAMSPADIDLGPRAGEYVYLNVILNLSAAVILYYDYVLTIPREIQFLWPPHNKQGWFTLTYFLNRYLPVFGYLPLVVSYFVPPSLSVCHRLHQYSEVLVMLLQSLPGTLCTFRVYALYGRSSRVLALLILIGSGTTISASAMLATSHGSGGSTITVISTIPGCTQFAPVIGGRYAALAWMGLLVFDSVIFSLTLYKAFTIGRGIRLLDVIVRDGAMYFSALFIVNLGNILMLWFSPPLLKTSTSALTNALSTTLISRLVLNLRERNSTLTCLPTTVETETRFRTALPAAGPIIPLRTVI